MRTELQHFPGDPVAHCILGQIQLNNSQFDEAEVQFRSALKANPRYKEALFGLGKAEIAKNHPEGAVEPLRKAVQLDPDYAEAHFVLGTALRKSGKAAEGIGEQKLSLALQQKKREAESQKAERK
jgi:cytochrome c-type biogenesis protein CcmH/NrfG